MLIYTRVKHIHKNLGLSTEGEGSLLQGDILGELNGINYVSKYIWAPPVTVVEWYIAHASMKQSMSTAINNSSTLKWCELGLNLCFFSTTYTYTHSHSQETVSNTLGHQFKRHQVSDRCRCDMCRETNWEVEEWLICSRESLHPPLLTSPFYLLLPSFLLLHSFLPCIFLYSPFSSFLPFPFCSPSPSPFLCFPSSHLIRPSSITECQVTVHTRCVNKLDKTCSEVSEGCMGRKGKKGP